MRDANPPDDLPRAKAERRDAPQDDTKVVRDRDGPSPRLPHEHDESADSVSAAPQPRIADAKRDLDRGVVDTDRGPPMDDAYKKQKR